MPAVSSKRTAALPYLLLLLLAVALNFGLRYGYIHYYAGPSAQQIMAGDGEDYTQIAYALAQTGHYGRPVGLDVKIVLNSAVHPAPVPTQVAPDSWRPPLWPLVLAALLRLTDYHLPTIFLLRFLLDAVTVGLFYALLLLLRLPPAAGAVGLLLFAAQPTWLFYSISMLSEPLTLLLQVLVAISGVLWLNRPGDLRRAALFGLCAGIGILGHPFMLLFPLLFVGVAYWRRLLPGRAGLLALAILLLVLTPWIGRNMTLYHTLKPILTTSQGKSLAKGWNSQFLATYNNTSAEMQGSEPLPATVDPRTLDQAALSDLETSVTLRFIAANWRLVPALATRKFIGALTPIPETVRPGILETGRTLFQVLTFVPLLCVLRARIDRRVRLLVGAALVAYLFMAVLTLPAIRYRFPIMWSEILSFTVALSVLGPALARWWAVRRVALPAGEIVVHE